MGRRSRDDGGAALRTRQVAFVLTSAVAFAASGCGAGPGDAAGPGGVNPGDTAGSPQVNAPDSGAANDLIDAAGSSCSSGDGGPCGKAIAIAASDEFACAVLSGGAVECWGANDTWANITGDPSTRITSAPLAVTGLTGATALALAYDSGCALIADGTVECWGLGVDQLAGVQPTLTPMTVMGLNDAVAIAAGEAGYCALRSGGIVSCWGGTLLDVNGSALGPATPSSTAVDIPGIAGAKAIGAGAYGACAALTPGDAQCWGEDYVSGALDGPMPLSAMVSGPPLGAIVQIEPAVAFVCARDSDGNVACWGSNASGQLGDGTQTDMRNVIRLVDLGPATAIATGRNDVCAVTMGGAVSCWGDNRTGQLGGGSAGTLSTVPVAVRGLSARTLVPAEPA